MTDLFDLKNTEDLPEKLREYVKEKEKKPLCTMVCELFKIAKRPLSVAEIVVALYRKFNYEIKYSYCTIKMLAFSRNPKNHIKKISSIFYEYEE